MSTNTSYPQVIARVLTLAGEALGRADLAVTITETGPRDAGSEHETRAECGGCGLVEHVEWNTDSPRSQGDVEFAAWDAAYEARQWSRDHAEQCRELSAEVV